MVADPFLRDPGRSKLQNIMSGEGAKRSGSLTTYAQVINTLLGTYASNGIVSKAEAELKICVETEWIFEVKLSHCYRRKPLDAAQCSR